MRARTKCYVDYIECTGSKGVEARSLHPVTHRPPSFLLLPGGLRDTLTGCTHPWQASSKHPARGVEEGERRKGRRARADPEDWAPGAGYMRGGREEPERWIRSRCEERRIGGGEGEGFVKREGTKKKPEALGPGGGRPVRAVMRRVGRMGGRGGTAGSRCAGCWEPGGEANRGLGARADGPSRAPALACSGKLFRGKAHSPPLPWLPCRGLGRGDGAWAAARARRDYVLQAPVRAPWCSLAPSTSRPERDLCHLARSCSRPARVPSRPKSLACVKASAHAGDVVGPDDAAQPSFAEPAAVVGQSLRGRVEGFAAAWVEGCFHGEPCVRRRKGSTRRTPGLTGWSPSPGMGQIKTLLGLIEAQMSVCE